MQFLQEEKVFSGYAKKTNCFPGLNSRKSHEKYLKGKIIGYASFEDVSRFHAV
jgi:hypothetical protein